MINWIMELPWGWIYLAVFTACCIGLAWALSAFDDDDDDDDDPTGTAATFAALMAMS